MTNVYQVETRVVITRYVEDEHGRRSHTTDRMEFGDTRMLPAGQSFAEAAAIVAQIQSLVQEGTA